MRPDPSTRLSNFITGKRPCSQCHILMRAPPVGIQAFILFPIWQKFNASNAPQIKKENKVLQYDSLTLNLSLHFLFQSHAVLICPSYRLSVCPFLSDCVPTPLCPCSILVLSCLSLTSICLSAQVFSVSQSPSFRPLRSVLFSVWSCGSSITWAETASCGRWTGIALLTQTDRQTQTGFCDFSWS